MIRKLFPFFALSIFILLNGCNSPENQNQAEKTTTVAEEKNANVSATKTNSQPVKDAAVSEKPIEKPQPDSADFYRVLTFKNIAFKVKAVGKGSLQQVTIQPSGLTATNRTEKLETEPVVDAEVNDLNADGYPELLLFTQSAGSGSYGKVVAFSVNNGKSMSRVTFPETGQNPELKKGYGGHDKFSIVNNLLTHEFPIYNDSDVNSKPTGKKKVVTYKLKDGEASRIFVVDQVKEVLE